MLHWLVSGGLIVDDGETHRSVPVNVSGGGQELLVAAVAGCGPEDGDLAVAFVPDGLVIDLAGHVGPGQGSAFAVSALMGRTFEGCAAIPVQGLWRQDTARKRLTQINLG